MDGVSRIFTMRYLWCRIGLLLAIVLAPAIAYAADPPALIAFSDEQRPFSFKAPDGSVAGIGTTLVRRLAEAAKLTVEFRMPPQGRAYAEALKQPGRLLYPAVRTAERETAFRWIGPILPGGVYPGSDQAPYLALDPATDPAIADRLETAFRAMVESGEVARIMRPRTGFVAGALPFRPWYMQPIAGIAAAGVMPDLDHAIAVRLGIDVEIAPQPNVRLIEGLTDGTIDFSVAIDDERLRRNMLECGSIGALDIVAVSRADQAVTTLEALRGRRIGLLNGVAPDAPLADLSVERVPVESAEQSLRLVLADRVAAAVMSVAALDDARLSLTTKDAALLAPPLVVSRRPVYIWVSAASRLAPRCAEIKTIAEALNRDGTMEEILARYR